VEHERNWDGDATTGEVIGNHANLSGNGSKCNICHVYATRRTRRWLGGGDDEHVPTATTRST